jgi:DNA invertase Pin-like site-specific DNA recombinase
MREHKIGYVRINNFEQDVDRLLEGIKLDKIFTDKAAENDAKQPEFEALMQCVHEGDTVVVHSADHLSSDLEERRAIVQKLTGRGIKIQFVKEGVIFNEAVSQESLSGLSENNQK